MTLADAKWSGWVFPLPTLNGRQAEISDGFSSTATGGHRQHLGVDIMYRRLVNEPAELPRGSKMFYVPEGTPVLAAYGGKIWQASLSETYGHNVTIDHGNVPGIGPCCTFYQHMSEFSRSWSKGDVVAAGERLGIVGGSLTGYPLHHLHFELWLPTRDKAVDPAPYMSKWARRGPWGHLVVLAGIAAVAIAGSRLLGLW